MKISYSFGMVDLLHFGHINALKKASENADLRIFGVVSDNASDEWFGTHVSNEKERQEVLESIKYIDIVMPQSTFDPTENLRKIHQDYPDAVITLYHGNDFGVISAKQYIESIGGQAVTFDYYEKLSPQRILDTLNLKKPTKKRFNNLISTKANTLLSLKSLVKKARIENILIITIKEFRENIEKVISDVKYAFKNGKIVVRSSSSQEDAFEASNAGHFESILGVDPQNNEDVKNAILKVIESYGKTANEDEQVLIQQQTENVDVSGVIFTRDIQRNRSYYVINYDESGSTDHVTAGIGGRVAWYSKNASRSSVPEKWKSLMEAVWEIESILPDILLDIEFAITKEGNVVIFQVRPLAAGYKFRKTSDEASAADVKYCAVNHYIALKDQGLDIFSDMAFWNPAEIIGDRPRSLDYSLYQWIITKNAWNAGLVSLGYKSIDKDLMYEFGSKPYISIELSFDTLTPASIKGDLRSKLLSYYKDKLKNEITAHDKIEFEIVHNCYRFDIADKLQELLHNGFSIEETEEIKNELHSLTESLIKNYYSILNKDLSDLSVLECERIDVLNTANNCNNIYALSRCVNTLLKSIRLYGTPQFSRQARCAFVAKALISSLVNCKYITNEDYDRFFESISTVASEFDEDYKELLKGNINEEYFSSKYGHLRVGTYNIRSPRYDQMDLSTKTSQESDLNYEQTIYNGPLASEPSLDLPKEAIENVLCEHGFKDVTYEILVTFVRKAIEQREYFKFVFTKSLSLVIELIKKMGTLVGMDVKELSYLTVPEILSAINYTSTEEIRDFWKLISDKRRNEYKKNSELILPAVITSEKDFDFVENIDARPNFITEKKVSAETIILDDSVTSSISGKIVVIEKADPGYDWIFTQGIAGLITKYGGAASHMAIRCAEFSIPAAIGCGDRIFNSVSSATSIDLDCKNERIRILDSVGALI